MRKKVLLLLALTAVMSFGCGLYGCSESNDDSGSKSSVEQTKTTITLSQTAAEMDVYDQITLIATTNSRNDVSWKSSDETVASVTAGTVRALKEGTATITATVDGESATCAITIVDSHTAPVLSVERDSVSVQKDEEYNIPISVLWKGEPVTEAVTYSVVLDDESEEGVAEMTFADGSLKVVGKNYGDVVFYVSATVRGTNLAKKISVKVCNTDVRFEVANLTAQNGKYVAELPLVATESAAATITPDVSVYNKDTLDSDAVITWTGTDSAVAVMTDGVIMPVGEGSTTFYGEYQNNQIIVLVNVYRPEIVLEDKIVIETSRLGDGKYALPSRIEGIVRDVKIDGKTCFSGVNEGKVELDVAALGAIAVSDMGEKTALIETDKAKYTLDCGVYTMAIRNKTDLDSFMSEAKKLNADANKYDGYFALTNDIEYSGKYTVPSISGDSRQGYGFNGVFDGNGYAIYNFEFSQGGLVGKLALNGIVRNTSFIGAKNAGAGGLLGLAPGGTVKNLYINIDVTPNSGEWDSANAVLTPDAYGTFRLYDVIVEYVNPLPANATTGYVLWNINLGYGSYNGLYVVGTDKVYSREGSENGGGAADVMAAYSDWETFKKAGITLDNEFWKTVNGYVSPRNMGNLTPSIGNEDSVVPVGVLTIDCTDPYVVFSLENAPAGITLDGRKLSVGETAAPGSTFSVVATNIISGNQDRLELTVLDSVVINVADYKAETSSGELVIDLSQKSIDGELVSIAAGTTALTVKSNEAGVITVDIAGKKLYGENTIILTYHKTDGSDVVKITTVNVDALLVTKYLSTKDDLLNLGNYAVDLGNYEFGGYFEQTADIAVGGTRVGLGTWGGDVIEWNFRSHIVYDGCGHVIDGILQGTNEGIFCNMLEDAVVKNLVLTNAVLNGQGGIIVTDNKGTVENVTVYGSFSSACEGPTWSPNSLLVGKMNGGLVRNCLVVIEDYQLTSGSAGIIVGVKYKGEVENCIAVNLKTNTSFYLPAVGGVEDNTTETVKSFRSWSEVASFVADNNSLAKNIIPSNMKLGDNNIPVPVSASVKNYFEITHGAMETYVKPGETVTLEYSGFYADVVIDSESIAAGITCVNGVIAIPENITLPWTLTITVVNLADVSKNENIVVNVIENKESVSLTGAYYVELNNGTTASAISLTAGNITDGSLVSAILDGTDITGDVTYNAGVLSVNTANIANTVWGEKSMIVTILSSKVYTVTIPVTVITKVIRTADDVLNWNNLSFAADAATNYWAGYFVLGNNIDMTGKLYDGKFYYSNMHSTETWTPFPEYAGVDWKNGRASGFRGIFDGKGYTIDNITMNQWTGSFCGQIATAGIFRNVAFKNVTLKGGASLVSVGGTGKIENVYAHIKSAVDNDSRNDCSGVFFGADSMGETRVKNCFAKFDDVPQEQCNGFTALGAYHLGYGILTNVYGVGLKSECAIRELSNSGAGGDTYGTYETATAFAAAVKVTAENGWDMSIWTTDADGLPTFITAEA